MPGSDLYKSPANAFLREEVYKLGSSRGIRSMPPGPRRDFLVLTWGPVVYVTSYPTKSKPLLHSLIRCLNDAVRTSIHRNLSGSDDLLHRLEVSYMVKVFDAKDVYDGMDVDSVRNAFRDFKMSLALPTTDLPGRMRSCLMVDEEVLAKSAKALANTRSRAEPRTRPRFG
ncbi:hypothetical protein N7470_003863 [Penicillium chermesinum]|nr:hypothetical protein N7470_003863 [Penicillium chermesinum]